MYSARFFAHTNPKEAKKMWLLITLIIIAGFILFSQFISRLDGENFRGLGKIITSERPISAQNAKTNDAFEIISGQNAPFFDTLLMLSLDDPQTLNISWKISHEEYARAVSIHHASGTDTTKAVLKLNYTGRLYFKEEYPISLNEQKKQLSINAPGCEICAEIGFYTDASAFFALACSNKITVPS